MKINSLDTILFDMDGVLVDESDSYRLAIKKTVESFLNQPISFQEIQKFKNRGGVNNDWDCSEAILISKGKNIKRQRIVDLFQQFYVGDNFDGFILNEKWLVKDNLLADLASKYSLGIVTGRPQQEAEIVLTRFNARTYFRTIITMADVPAGKSKPDPFGIQLALKNLSAKSACYVGDTIDDMKAAMAAGIIAVGIIAGHNYSEQKKLLEKNGAMFVLSNINKITEILP